MKKAIIKKEDGTIICRADVACGFFEKFMGLMLRKSIPGDYGLLIRRCNQIHMMNMRFPLDIIYLSRENEVIHTDRNIQPGRIGKPVRNAADVIEVTAGTCEKLTIERGMRLKVEHTDA